MDHRFNQTCLDLLTIPKPTIATIEGHAIAGGCVLTLCCDYRFMAHGRKFMGLNEIKLGVPVPYLVELIHVKKGVPKEQIACKGCRQQDGQHFHLPPEGCTTLNCVKAKDVDFCCDSIEFPCCLLAPTADGASQYPHNMKVFNLCRIKKVGIQRWVEKEAGDIRKKYFSAKFIVDKVQTD